MTLHRKISDSVYTYVYDSVHYYVYNFANSSIIMDSVMNSIYDVVEDKLKTYDFTKQNK